MVAPRWCCGGVKWCCGDADDADGAIAVLWCVFGAVVVPWLCCGCGCGGLHNMWCCGGAAWCRDSAVMVAAMVVLLW